MLSPDQPLECTRAQEAFGGDVAILNVSKELRLDPRRFRLFDQPGKLRFGANDRIELFPDLA